MTVVQAQCVHGRWYIVPRVTSHSSVDYHMGSAQRSKYHHLYHAHICHLLPNSLVVVAESPEPQLCRFEREMLVKTAWSRMRDGRMQSTQRYRTCRRSGVCALLRLTSARSGGVASWWIRLHGAHGKVQIARMQSCTLARWNSRQKTVDEVICSIQLMSSRSSIQPANIQLWYKSRKKPRTQTQTDSHYHCR